MFLSRKSRVRGLWVDPELTSEQRSGVGAAMEAESRSATNTLVYLKICLVSDLLRNKACETLTL